jgi:hypothetical protein
MGRHANVVVLSSLPPRSVSRGILSIWARRVSGMIIALYPASGELHRWNAQRHTSLLDAKAYT